VDARGLEPHAAPNDRSDCKLVPRLPQAPRFAVAPVVSVKGSTEIDPCSALELRAMADSPRPLVFAWSCRNDDALNLALGAFTEDTLYLDSGTSEMVDVDKVCKCVFACLRVDVCVCVREREREREREKERERESSFWNSIWIHVRAVFHCIET
jgi:hypothetical protein